MHACVCVRVWATQMWLDSRRGYNSGIVTGYEALSVNAAARTIELQDKTITLGPTGLPASIIVSGHELLARPMEFRLLRPKKVSNERFTFVQSGPGLAEWLCVYHFALKLNLCFTVRPYIQQTQKHISRKIT